MKEKICLLFVFVCVCFCFGACNSTIPEQESVSQEATAFLEKYNDFFVAENAQRASLLYIDEDSIPELLVLKNGEYRLYFFDGSEVKAIDMPNTEIIASAYGPQYDFQEQEYETFYWFEYVPYKGLIRVHNGADGERHDYYLKYVNGSFITELGTESSNYTWHTFDAENEIENDGFLIQLSDLGYDQLIPCNYLYDNVAAAYENIGAVSDTKKVLDDFVNGEVDALDYVTEISDIPEDSFVMKSYKDYFDEITAGEDFWGSEEYVDFDNDGEDELIIHGYAGSCLFFDVIGDTVYKVLRTSSTTDVAYVAEFNGKRVVVRTDLTHRGRQSYRIMEFDPCCGLVDWINLYAEYEGSDYFEYRNNEITRDEFEDIVNSIQQLVSEQSEESVRTLTHGVGWRQYEDVMDFGENGVSAKDIDFITSDGRGYNNGVYWPMRNILYDLGLVTGLDLLSDYWTVERVIPIGGEYYNVLLSQKASGRRVDLLWAMWSDEYKVLYVVCNEGDKETYNGVRYLSSADWMPYQAGWIPFRDESADISIDIENPFEDIQEASACRVLELALMSYVETEGAGENWEVREVFGWYSLTECLVVSEDEILWICVDSYEDEKFLVEVFKY